MIKTFDLFENNEMSDVTSKIIYYYLFEDLSLTAIESKLFGTENYKGWFCKSILNFYGIDTSGENKGIFYRQNVLEVIDKLYTTNDYKHIRIAKLLKDNFG